MISIDWSFYAGLAVCFAIAGSLSVATIVVLVQLVRRRTFGTLGALVLVCWSSVGIFMISKNVPEQIASAPQPVKKNPNASLGDVAKLVVLKQLRDPASATFGNINVYSDRKLKGKSVVTACGSVNSRNGFGGYSGAQNFIVFGGSYQAVFDDDRDNSAFVALWNGLCAGKHS